MYPARLASARLRFPTEMPMNARQTNIWFLLDGSTT
jgi:hypothetical protein